MQINWNKFMGVLNTGLGIANIVVSAVRNPMEPNVVILTLGIVCLTLGAFLLSQETK